MKPLVIVQARMRSSRLPGKVMLPICGKPMLARVVERAQAADVGDVVVATGADAANDPIKEWCIDNQVRCLAPAVAEDDVLARFVRVAETCGAEYVLRLTADCALIVPEAIRQVAEAVCSGDWHYVTNAHPSTGWPEGMDCEGFTEIALAVADDIAEQHREHPTREMRRLAMLFKCGIVRRGRPGAVRAFSYPPQSRWSTGPSYSVDTEADLARVRRIYEAVGGDIFGLEDIEACQIA